LRPRIDAIRDDCTMLWTFAMNVLINHSSLLETFVNLTGIGQRYLKIGDTLPEDMMYWLESRIHNVIFMQHVEKEDGLGWHLDDESNAIIIYDNGGVEFSTEFSKVRHMTVPGFVRGTVAHTNDCLHRSVIDGKRNVIVIFLRLCVDCS
jgi:hypothetical protein